MCFSIRINKHRDSSICAVGDSTPGLPFQVAGPQGERLPVLEPEHLARRRRHVPAPTPGTVSPHSTCTPLTSLPTNGPKGEYAQLTRLPVRFAEGSHGGSGRGASTPLPKGSCRRTQSLPRLSSCSLISLLFLLHGGAVRPGHSGGAVKYSRTPCTLRDRCLRQPAWWQGGNASEA